MERVPRRAVLSAIGGLGTAAGVSVTGRPGRRPGDESWTQYGYDDGNTAHAPDNTGPDSPVGVAWRFDAGDAVYSQPAVADGTVYVGSGDGTVYALAASDGTARWQTATGGPVQCSPTVVDGTVYIGTNGGTVSALRPEDGTEKWTFETSGGVFGGLAVAGDTLYAALDGGEPDRSFVAIDNERGTERWSVGGFGTATNAAVVDETVYIGTGSQDVRAYDAATGTRRWRFKTADFVFTPPTVADGVVYAGSNDDAGTFYAVETTDGSERWRFETGAITGGHSAAVAGGTVFVANGSRLVALSVADGDTRWTVPISGSRGPAVVDGTVYVAGSGIIAVDAASGAVEWRVERNLKLVSPIAVTDGSIYAGSQDGFVYRLSSAASSAPGTRLGGVSPVDNPTGNPVETTIRSGQSTHTTDSGETRTRRDVTGTRTGDGPAGNSDGTRGDGGTPRDDSSGIPLLYGLLSALAASGICIGVGAYWLRDGDSDSGISIQNTHDAPLACKLKCRTNERVVFEGATRLEAGETRTLRESLPDERFEVAVGVQDGATTSAVFEPAAVTAISITVGPETAEMAAE